MRSRHVGPGAFPEWPSKQVSALPTKQPPFLLGFYTVPSPHPLLPGDGDSHSASNLGFLHILFAFLTLCLHL